MSRPAAVVDIRRPSKLEPVLEELRAGSWDRVFALSPLAADLLEQAGAAFETNAALVERERFRELTLGNHARVRRALAAAFGSDHESWLGLMLELTAFAAYAIQEEMRLTSLDGLDVHVFSDVPRETLSLVSLERHLYNGGALYFAAALPANQRLAARRSELAARLSNRLRRLTPAALARKAAARLTPAGRGPAIVTVFDYDWAPLRAHLSRRFSARSYAQVCAAARALGGPGPDDAALDRLAADLEAEFRPLLARTLRPFLAMCRDRAARYGLLRRRLSDHLPALISRWDLRGAVGTIGGTDEQYLVHHFMKAAGLPSLMYQHGGYMQRWPMHGPLEAQLATHMLAYGSEDETFLAGLRADGRAYRVGSALLEGLAPDRPVKGRFLYVTYLTEGNLLLTESELARHDTDHAALFKRHARVLEAFARSAPRGSALTIRHHPSQYTWALYEPLRELVARRRIAGVSFDRSPVAPDRYLAGYEGVLMDYPSTGLLHALAKGKRVACHLGMPYGSAGDELLRRAAACADDDDAFVALAERWFSRGADEGDPAARRAYLDRFALAGEPAAPVVGKLLDGVLK